LSKIVGNMDRSDGFAVGSSIVGQPPGQQDNKTTMAMNLTKFVSRFVEEAREHLFNISDGLASLEQGADDAELINALFRSAHTVKGSARMVKLTTISEVAHLVEDLLAAMRSGTLQYSTAVSQALYSGIDEMSRLVDLVAENPEDPELPEVDEKLCLLLAAPLSTDSPERPAPAIPEPLIQTADESETDSEPVAETTNIDAILDRKLKVSDTVRVQLSKLDQLIKLMGEMVSSHARMDQRLYELRSLERKLENNDALNPLLPQLKQFNRSLKDGVLAQKLLMDELHDSALLMRMLPLAMVFDSTSRLVRELAQSMGKQVECVISGSEIELDRQMIDQLSDPILHLLRNALDHGIEFPEQRQKVGKSAVGRISLSAYQDGSWVVIEISDDGAGIDIDRVKSKAVRKGLISEDLAEVLSQEEIVDLIFTPGFSTSAIITEMSGRGVGMDVVKRSIVVDLQGLVSVATRPGHGSTFNIRLPLSLAVMRVLLFEIDSLPFGLTSQHIATLVRVPRDSMMAIAGGRQAVILDNEFVPVVSLSGIIKVPELKKATKLKIVPHPTLQLVVVQVRHEKMALIVDALLDEQDLVIKPLPKHLRQIETVSGMVVTGKNELVSVLHAPALFAAARKLQQATLREGQNPENEFGTDALKILVVDDSPSTREIEKELLESYGYQVTVAEDGQDGLNKAKAELFDAVLTDVEMPIMDGFSLTSKLREEKPYQAVPIIIITSREREEDKHRGVQVGADAYIVKSDFEQSSLIETLKTLLG
jgi:two-component system, chemotaxis family, sensor kinase CheA